MTSRTIRIIGWILIVAIIVMEVTYFYKDHEPTIKESQKEVVTVESEEKTSPASIKVSPYEEPDSLLTQ